jgi:hypothetical protein
MDLDIYELRIVFRTTCVGMNALTEVFPCFFLSFKANARV